MKHTKQSGFSVVELLVVIVIVGLAAISLLVVSLRKQAKQADKQAQTSQSQATQQIATPGAKDYTTYSNVALGFSFAYPKDWGAITVTGDSPTAAATGATPAVRNAKSYPYHSGSMNFAFAPKNTYKIAGQTQGATYVPVLKNSSYSNYIWKVVSVDPADRTDKIGDLYSAPIVTSEAGVQLYDFNVNDKGSNTKRWAFETKAGFVTLAMPAFGSDSNDPSAAATTAQLAIANAIPKSVQLIY